MKKTGLIVLSVFLTAVLCIGIYYILYPGFDNGNLNHNPAPDRTFSISEHKGEAAEKYDFHIEAGSDAENIQSPVTHSSIDGYLMMAEKENINVYEIYDNGHKEKIRTLDINPKHMRKNDYLTLTEGIFVDTYTGMCSLIEDFSS